MKHRVRTLGTFTLFTLVLAGSGLQASCTAEVTDRSADQSAERTGEATDAVTSIPNQLMSSRGTNLCLKVHDGGTTPGTNTELWTCNRNNPERWTLTSAGALQSSVAPNLCLDVTGGHTANGTLVQIATCGGGLRQQWTYTAQSELRSALGSNLCLDVSDGPAQNGTNAQIKACDGTNAQKWTDPQSTADWMAALGPAISGKQLNQLVFPGTHDSGTYGIIPPSQRPIYDMFAPDAESWFVNLGSLVGITEPWAIAQYRDIGQQLGDGIRSLDFRPCIDLSGTLRICHSLYGPALQDMLNDVATFAASHPQEIILLQFSNYSENGTTNNQMSDANVTAVQQMIQTTLAGVLVDQTTVTPSTTIQTLWTQQPGKTVIVSTDRWSSSPAGASPSWSFWYTPSNWTNSWQDDVWYMPQKKSELDTALASSPQSTMFVLSGQATPNNDAIVLAGGTVPGQTSTYPSSLQDLAAGVNPVMLRWMLNDWTMPLGPTSQPSDAKRINVVAVDFYDQSCFMDVVWYLDGATSQSLDGCNIVPSTWDSSASQWTLGPSVWATWVGAMSCPSGYTDLGADCLVPTAYTRANYPWEFGDPLDNSGMYSRCEADYGSGNCEECGDIVYPKCEPYYYTDWTCTVCYPGCPPNMTPDDMAGYTVDCEK